MRPVKNTYRSSRGFTLIEMAMVVMILGLIIAAFTPAYKLYLDHKAEELTQANIENITAAIGAFREINGRYPCPASLTAQRGDAAYGREDCRQYNTAVPLGTCASGFCRERSLPTRTFDYMDPFAIGHPMIVNGVPNVRVGAVPFRELNLTEKNAYDGYDSRIEYAVTENLMNDVTFRPDGGGIEIKDNSAANRTLLDPPASAHFLVLSHGKNTSGAYGKTGVQNACPASGPERENCSNVTGVSRYTQIQQSSNNNGTAYDDVMTYFTQSEVPLWQISTADSKAIVQKPGGDVGMNFVSAEDDMGDGAEYTETHQATVRGDLRAHDVAGDPLVQGMIMANELCSPGGDCFAPQLLAGKLADGGGIKCPDDEYMAGIADGVPICVKELSISCPPGQTMTGIDADGQRVCTSPPPCLATTVKLCNVDLALPESPAGTIHTVVAGLSAHRQFRCVAESWEEITLDPPGVCKCNPTKDNVVNASCGPGFAGTVVQTRNTICPTVADPRGTMPRWEFVPPTYAGNGPAYTYPPDSPCSCVGDTDEQDINCPPNRTPVDASGNAISQQTRTFECTGPRSGKWTAWTPPYTCKCDPPADTSEDQWVACGGTSDPGTKKKQTRVFNPGSCSWSGWTDTDTSACVCTKKWSETVTDDPCPAGHVGAITNRYDYECGKKPVITEIKRTCEKAPTAICALKPNGYSQLLDAPTGEPANTACVCGPSVGLCYVPSASGKFRVYQSCTCGN
jgi:prepilin-type N-terminal cleavage/methylation domain-containing protein